MSTLSKIYHPLKDYLLIFFGTMMYSFGLHGFIVSNEIVPGGLTGICSLVYYISGIPISISYGVVNVFLFILAFKVLGKRFVLNSCFAVVSLTFSLAFFEWLLDGKAIIDGQPFMSLLIGATLCGTALGIIFSSNGSTGGIDIIGAIINKYKNISIGRALLFCDVLIICSSYFYFHDVEKIVFGFVEVTVNNYVLDRVLNANNQSVQFLIISKKYNEIVSRILKDFDRGCTLLDGEGAYSNEPAKVILLLVKRQESVAVMRLVKSIDNRAFISQSNVKGVYGEGFDVIKG